jgi:REP element-mobilizing transposase RayT
VIQALKLGVVRRLFFAALKQRSRSLSLFADNQPIRFWQHRFYDFNVWSERKRVDKLRYMHRNPVKRGLVERPDL